jgi:hypothetical protein
MGCGSHPNARVRAIQSKAQRTLCYPLLSLYVRPSPEVMISFILGSYSHASVRTREHGTRKKGLRGQHKTMNRGRHNYYRYGHPIHSVGMARHGDRQSNCAHTMTSISYNMRDREPHRRRTTPGFISCLGSKPHRYIRMYQLPPLVNYKRRQGPIQGIEGTTNTQAHLSHIEPRPKIHSLSHARL